MAKRKARIALIVLAALLAALVALPAPALAYPSGATLTIDQRGRAHGVGMCMGGAWGRGKLGQDYRTIIRYYYRGTTVATSSRVPARVKVHLGARSAFTVYGDYGTGGFTVRNGSGAWLARVPAGSYAAVDRPSGYRVRVYTGGALKKTVNVGSSVKLVPAIGVILRIPALGTYQHYRGNIIGVSGAIVNEVSMENYLKGISEEPESWPTQTLNTIAVLARTYASYRVAHPKYPGAPYHMLNTADSQVYWGYDYEKKAPNLTAAVNRTKGQVALYAGRPILAAYHGTCGGHTEDSSIAWGSSQSSYPYLRGVWCNPSSTQRPLPSNPFCKGYRGWSRTVRGVAFITLARKLGIPGEITSFSAWVRGYNKSSTGSPRVYSFRVNYRVRSGGTWVNRSVAKSGAQVERAFGFANNYFNFDLPPTVSSMAARPRTTDSDGVARQHTISLRLSERARTIVKLYLMKGATPIWYYNLGDATRSPGILSYIWNGRFRTPSGARAIPGTYKVKITVIDTRGNKNYTEFNFVIRKPVVRATLTRSVFSPGSSTAPTVGATYTLGHPTNTVQVTVKDATTHTVQKTLVAAGTFRAAGTYKLTWDGSKDGGGYVPDGPYEVVFAVKPTGLSATTFLTLPVTVDTSAPVVVPIGPVPTEFSASSTAPGSVIKFTTSETGTATLSIFGVGGPSIAATATPARTFTTPVSASTSISPSMPFWDGKNGAGDVVPVLDPLNGTIYAVEVRVADAAGNSSPVSDRSRPLDTTQFVQVKVTP
jgi:peptidoglycan hydrolase-like amidase